MVMVASGNHPDSEELQSFAANLTIDNEEYEMFNKGTKPVESGPKLPVHATTQDEAAKANFDKAADRNNFDMLALFGQGMEKAAPGQ